LAEDFLQASAIASLMSYNLTPGGLIVYIILLRRITRCHLDIPEEFRKMFIKKYDIKCILYR
jgi:hypothetical protein